MIVYYVKFKDATGNIDGIIQAFQTEDEMFDFVEYDMGINTEDIIQVAYYLNGVWHETLNFNNPDYWVHLFKPE